MIFCLCLLLAARSAGEIDAELEALAVTHADVARIETLGFSVGGRPILGLRIGDDRLPGVRILGGHHGDEPPSVEFPLAFAARVLSDRPVLLSAIHLLIVPMVNPDGFESKTRANAHDVDLNRNYGFAYRATELQSGAWAFSEPESRAIAFDNERHRYGSSLSYHAGAFNIGYPMNYTTTDLPSDALMLSYATAYKALVPDGAFWITRGAKWYISHGDTNDYSFGYFGGTDLTVEISAEKAPADDSVAIAQQMDAALSWLSHAEHTVQVFVRDAETDVALPATVASTEIVAVADPLRGEAELQIETAQRLRVSLPGYTLAEVDVTPQSGLVEVALVAERREHVEVTPFENDANAALDLSIDPPATAAWLYRPGEDNVDLTCDVAGRCRSSLGHRRPGHYALVSETDAGPVFTPNAVYLSSAETVSAPSEVWRVVRGGGATLDPAAEPEPGVDVLRVGNGAQALESAKAPPPPVEEEKPEPPVKGGCSTNGTDNICVVGSFLLLMRRWAAVSIKRTTTRKTH